MTENRVGKGRLAVIAAEGIVANLLLGTLFGWFVDITNFLVSFLPEPALYPVRLAWLVLGMACVGLGIFLYIAPGMPPLPGEGVMQVISEKFRIPLHWAKVGFDVTVTVIAVALSLWFFHGLHGVREGTVLAALGVGKFLGLFVRQWQGVLDRFLGKAARTETPNEAA